jgi:hypothetical protein
MRLSTRERSRRRADRAAQGKRRAGRNRLGYAIMPVVAVVILSGCGGGSGSPKKASPSTTVGSTNGAAGNAASLKKFQDCLAQHGVTIPSTTPGATFPAGGPGAGGDGPQGGPPGGPGGSGAPSAAIQACQSLAPAGLGSGRGQQALQAFVSCMSDHGVKLTAADPAVLRTVDRTTPAYKACSPLLPSGAPPSTTPTATTP